MPSLETVDTGTLLTAYLGAYARRLRDPLDVRPFPRPEPNALLAFAHARIAGRVAAGRPRDGARAACAALLGSMPEPATDALPAAICNCAALEAGAPELREAAPSAPTTPHLAAWRTLETVLSGDGEADGDALAYLDRRRARGGDVVGPGPHGPRLSYVLGLAATRAGGSPSAAALRDLAIAFLDPDATAAQIERAAELPTLQVVATAAAAAVNGLPRISDGLVARLASERLDGERGLLWAEPGGARYELSPWVAISLAEIAERDRRLDAFYAPVAPDPPAFAIERIETSDRGLRVRLRDPHGAVARDVPVADLDDMLAATVAEVERDDGPPQPPRQDAHMAIALHSLWCSAADDATRSRCEQLARTLLDRVVAAQRGNGGWDYSAPRVNSVVYTAAGATATVFPDLQYSIDAAVPGIALATGSRWLSEPRYLDSALAALRFFEDTIGRLRWEGARVWRLHPDDDKTARMGTAVNYELWNGAFFAELRLAADDSRLGRRLSGYLDDILAYCSKHLREDGGIGYGDYVREERLPYSAWDAYLLGRIGGAAERGQATEMGRRILTRMDGQLLDSGALPNAWPYVERGPSGDRWVVHRHGIGPYPIRAYYQLYPVVAAAACDASETLGLRSFAFAWLQLREEVTGRMSRGYSGAGDYDVKLGASVAACWKIDAIASLPRLGVPYAPSLDRGRDGKSRWDELVAATEEAGRAAGAEDPAWRRPPWLAELEQRLDAAEAPDAQEPARHLALHTVRRGWLSRFYPNRPEEDERDGPSLEQSLAFAVALRRAGRIDDAEAFDRYARTLLSRLLVENRDALGRWTESPGGAPLAPEAARRAAGSLRQLGEPDIGWLAAH